MNFTAQFRTKKCGNGIFAITTPMNEQVYLVCGKERALLIDTGMGIGSLKAVVDSLADLPVTVVNTHGHPDHAGGNMEFSEVWLHPDDNEIYKKMCSKDYRTANVRKIMGRSAPEYENVILPFMPATRNLLENQEFELGGRTLKTFQCPGHSKGSIMIYDSQTKSLFTGDSVAATEIWLFLKTSEPLETYYHALESFNKMGLDISLLYPGHLPSPVESTMLENMSSCVGNVLFRGEKGEPFETFAGIGLKYEYKEAKIIYDPDKLYGVIR